ncbi:hypothetical protein ACIRQH_00160 [Streptomyces sp. NPDC102279]|uniref:hypothetical protein n=1 Tax=Streptomyces sp. NPDC102279 TaxID=3366153 RepID=UPI0037F10ED5
MRHISFNKIIAVLVPVIVIAAIAFGASQCRSATSASERLGNDTAEQPIILAAGADRLPNETASDWVTYADHVVVATATDEAEIPPAQTEIDRGEGLIGRSVSMRIDRVLWSRPDAPKAAPATWQRTSPGWQFTNGDTTNRSEFAMEHRPRIEVGHTYIIALEWQAEQCSEGDYTPGQWLGLGSESTIPYDDSTIGVGEVEGSVQDAAEAEKAAASDPASTVENDMTGQSATDLAGALAEATPAPGVAPLAASSDATPCS